MAWEICKGILEAAGIISAALWVLAGGLSQFGNSTTASQYPAAPSGQSRRPWTLKAEYQDFVEWLAQEWKGLR